jgi:hypothetical protein
MTIKYIPPDFNRRIDEESTIYAKGKEVWSEYRRAKVVQGYGVYIQQQLPTCCAFMYIGGFDNATQEMLDCALGQVALWGRKAMCYVTARQTRAWEYLEKSPYAKLCAEMPTRMVEKNQYMVRCYVVDVPMGEVEGLPEKKDEKTA